MAISTQSASTFDHADLHRISVPSVAKLAVRYELDEVEELAVNPKDEYLLFFAQTCDFEHCRPLR